MDAMIGEYFTIFYEGVEPYLPLTFTGLAVAAASITSFHVILSRRNPGSSIAWMALVWLAPLAGVTAYLMFGINRIKRRAESLRLDEQELVVPQQSTPITSETLDDHIDLQGHDSMRHLLTLVNHVVDRPLVSGNRLTPLYDGDEAFPAMIEAIESATHSIHLATYIFDNDAVGREFVAALEAADKRGVEVRVLIDAAGLRYSIPSIYTRLRRAGISAARFLPSIIPPHIMTMNLRNHRKIMVVDGHLGFTGGINLRAHHRLADNPSHPTRDLHFRVQGPVVSHLQEIFAEDWAFSTGEDLSAEEYFPQVEPVGPSLSRGIPDGPDEDLDRLRLAITGAIASASTRIQIMTPYFIPDPDIISSLILASLRGVDVQILLPSKNNLPYVQWASMAHLGPLLKRRCQVFFTPPPFDHTKLMVVDGLWTLLGSANMDPRSLRLNFEFNLECWDAELAGTLSAMIDDRVAEATAYDLADHDGRSRLLQLRDGVAALMSPYL